MRFTLNTFELYFKYKIFYRNKLKTISKKIFFYYLRCDITYRCEQKVPILKRVEQWLIPRLTG